MAGKLGNTITFDLTEQAGRFFTADWEDTGYAVTDWDRGVQTTKLRKEQINEAITLHATGKINQLLLKLDPVFPSR